MPEATSTKDDLTSADLTRPEPPDPYFYNCTKLWPPTSEALVWALANGRRLVTGDQLPPLPSDWEYNQPVISQWQADVHARLQQLGLLDAYRAHLTDTAYAVNCPWWCAGRHAMLIDGDLGQVIHASTPCGGVDFDDKPDLHKAATWTLAVTQGESPDGQGGIDLGPVLLTSVEDPLPEALDVEDIECVARATRQAAERFAAIMSATATAATSVSAA